MGNDRAISARTNQMLNVVRNLDPTRVFATHLSKLTPTDIQRYLERIPQGVDPKAAQRVGDNAVCLGSSLCNFYTDQDINTEERAICNLARDIQSIAADYGLMETKDAPLMPQEALHSTISSLILDKTNTVHLDRCCANLMRAADRFAKLLCSDAVRDIKLEMTEFKFLPDGNLGFQFLCDPKQNIELSAEQLESMLEKKKHNLSPSQVEELMSNLNNPKNGMAAADHQQYSLSRLQFLRLKVALLGGEVKAWYPGTLMVVGWTRDAEALKQRKGLTSFLEASNKLTQRFIATNPYHTLSNIYESLNESRTHQKRTGITPKYKGEMVNLLRAEWLLSRALLPKSIVLVHSAGKEFDDNFIDPIAGILCPHDPKLDEKGRTKSKEYGKVLRETCKRFPGFLNDVVILSSPMRRSVETAANISEQISDTSDKPNKKQSVYIETALAKSGCRLNDILGRFERIPAKTTRDGQRDDMRLTQSERAVRPSLLQPAHTWGKHQNTEVSEVQDQFGLGHLYYSKHDNSPVFKGPNSAQDSQISNARGVEESYRRFPKDREISDFQERCNRIVAAMQSSPGLANKHVIMVTHREVFSEILSRIDPSRRHMRKNSDPAIATILPAERLVHLAPSDSGIWSSAATQSGLTVH